MSFQNSDSDDLQPRAPRKRKRSSAERGWASDHDLAKLDRTDLEVKHLRWPVLVNQDVRHGQLALWAVLVAWEELR